MARTKMCTSKDEGILSGLLAKNPVWNEIGGGNTAELADSIETGEWIGLMTGAEDDTDAGWDKYIADTFGPFADFVEGRYIKPDEGEPDFRVAQIKFKPLFNRLPTSAKAGLLADLGNVLKDGYLVENKDEGINAVLRSDPKYDPAFMIDCGSPENAKALYDSFMKAAFKENGHDYNIQEIGGELIQCWPIGRYFTACVDPCDKAIEWCQNFLKNLGGTAPALTGNDSGLEGKTSEADLSAKLRNRAKVRELDNLFNQYHGFKEWGPSFSDLYNNGKFGAHMAVPGDGDVDKNKVVARANNRFADFDDYADWTVELFPEGGPDGEDMWFPCLAFKPSIMDLSLEDAKIVFGELAHEIDKAMGY